MFTAYTLIVACGVLALLYGVYTIRSVLAAPVGTDRMQEIASAIQEGANAYLNRQYTAIAIAGIVIGVILGLLLGLTVAGGFFIGAVLSGAAGYIGMNVSVRANVRTAEAARSNGLAAGLVGAALRFLCEQINVHVARSDIAPSGGDADHGFFKITGLETGGVEHCAGGCTIWAI